MIATLGYDGFLYSIGYLAGWVVALFVVAEPMKRMGKFTFTDALDAKFDSRGIKLAAAISTLLNDPALAMKMGIDGRASFSERFTVDAMASSFENMMLELIKKESR